MTKRTRPLLAATLLLLAAACAAPSPKVGKDTKIRENQGVVALAVQNNVMSDRLWDSYLFEWKQAFIKRKGAKGTMGTTIELASRKEGMRDSIVFFAEVAPGTYSLEKLSSLSGGGYGRYYETRFPEEFQFTVKAGRVTNLGTVVTAISPKGGFTSDASIYRGVLQSDAEMRDYLAGAFPAILAQQQGEPFQTWVSPTAMTESAELAGRIRRFSTGMNSPAHAKDGTWYAGAPMGMVWRRTAKGEWNSLDTGYAREITAVGTLADGGVLAAAEGGALLHSTDRGETWKNLGPLPRYGLVLATGQFGKGKLYAVVNEGGRNVSLMLADRVEGPWTQAATAAGPATSSGWEKGDTRVIPAGLKLALIVGERELKIYDGATGTWNQQTLPGDSGRVVGFDDGTLFVAHELPPPPKAAAPKGKAKGEKAEAEKPKKLVAIRKTIDGGATWQDVATYDVDAEEYAFFSSTVLMRRIAVPLAAKDATPVEQDVAYSADGGKTWTDYPREKKRFLTSKGAIEGDRMLLFYGLDVIASTDKGKTWKREPFIFPKFEKKDKDASAKDASGK